MSYTSENTGIPRSKLALLLSYIEGNGFKKVRDFLKIDNRVASYFWFEEEDYHSHSGVELDVYIIEGGVVVETRSTVSRSYWDLKQQNKVIKGIRALFGGSFVTDGGRNRCWSLADGRKMSALESGCYLARWIFHNTIRLSDVYLMTRSFPETVHQKATGLHLMDRLNPRLLSNNMLVPFALAVWEDYFRKTFVALIRNVPIKGDNIFKKAGNWSEVLQKIVVNRTDGAEAIAGAYSFQRPSIISERFRQIDPKLDVSSVLRKPYLGRKTNLFESINALVDSRNRFVHASEMDFDLFDKEIRKRLLDLEVAVERTYSYLGAHFGFKPAKEFVPKRRLDRRAKREGQKTER